MNFVGQVIGGTIAIYLLTRLIRLPLRRLPAPAAAATAAGVGLAIATLVGGYGKADGGAPQFLQAFVVYLLPALICLAIDVARARRVAPPVQLP